MKVPHDEQIEIAILGAAMRDSDGLDSILKLNSTDFYTPIHSETFKAILSLADASSPVNVASVSNKLRETRMLDIVGGTDTLRNWVSQASGSQPAFFADKLRKMAFRREMVELSGQMLTGACDEQEDEDSVFDRIFARFQAMASGAGEVEKTFGEGMRETLDRIIDGVRNGRPSTEISTGLTKLDYFTAGLHRQDLIVIAGRTSAGKTSFAVQIACHVAIHYGPVLLFSLEMPKVEIHKRLYSLQGSIDMQSIRNWTLDESDLYAMERVYKRVKDVPLIIDDSSDVSLRTVRLRARKMKTPPILIVVDYMQIMRLTGSKQDTRTRELDEASRMLKQMARDFNCPVIALSQLNRAVGTSADKIPTLDNLRESGGIANNADLVLFVHSTFYDAKPGEEIPEVVPAEIISAKQRNGPRNVKVPVQWRPSCVRFEEEADQSDQGDPFGDPPDDSEGPDIEKWFNK